jgi:predicted RNA methylase
VPVARAKLNKVNMFYRINGSIINENFINRVEDVTNELKSGTYDQDVRKKIESGVHYFRVWLRNSESMTIPEYVLDETYLEESEVFNIMSEFTINDVVDVSLPTGFTARGKIVRELMLEGLTRYHVIDLADQQTIYTVGAQGMRKVG